MHETIPKPSPSRLEGLGVAGLLGLALMVLSFSRRFGELGTLQFQNGVLDSMFANGVWGTALGRNLFMFVLALTATHAGYAIAVWLLARASAFAFPAAAVTRKQWVLVWAMASAVWLLVANAALFPGSSLGSPYAAAVRAGVGPINVFHVVSTLLVCGLAAVVIRSAIAAVRAKKPASRQRVRVIAAVGASLGAIGIAVAYASHSGSGSSDKPNVIIIGLDSFRHDVAHARGPDALAPNVRRFLDGAVSFSDAMTPLARTYPSWVSILTGRDPYTTGAVLNLLPRGMVQTGDTLGDMYRRAGYRTVYGIDEVRFSNIDASYGFDQTLTPQIGASDFFLGYFADTPLSNLVVNTWLGEWLFPHVYANRADNHIYDPDEFVARIDRHVRFDEPTFLALHLTLAHWPYGWSRSKPVARSTAEIPAAYRESAERVDQQFADVMSVLERRGALKNALVIVLSDHGEGLGKPDDLLIPNDSLLGKFDASMASHGHGTSVLSPHQYHVVLSMRTYGDAKIKLPAGTQSDVPVTLEDLAPTLAEISGLQSRQPFDGQSLAPLLRGVPGADEPFRKRVRFTETEFNPRGVAIAVQTTTSALGNAARYYRVDPKTDRLEVRPELINDVYQSRQFAAVLGDRILAAIPRENVDITVYDMVTVGRDGSGARKLRDEPSATEDPQLAQLWDALHSRLGLTKVGLQTDAKP
jgi:arylsulfatase A-like enzyme